MPILSNFPSGSAYLQSQINALNTKIDSKNLKYFEIQLPVSGWSGDAPSVQTAVASGITAEWKPLDPVLLSSGDWAADELKREAFSLIDIVETGSDEMTFSCYGGAPESDISIGVYVYWETT